MAKKHKIYAMLLVLGLAGLAVDRIFFQTSQPETVFAEPPAADGDLQPQTSQPAASAGAALPASKLSIPELRFPRDLPLYDGRSEFRDIFAPATDSSTKGTGGSGTTAESSMSDATRVSGRIAFEAAHRVDAVMIQDSLKIAVIDGRWMQLGDQLEECTLSRIEGDVAIFQCHDGEATLSPSRKKTRNPD